MSKIDSFTRAYLYVSLISSTLETGENEGTPFSYYFKIKNTSIRNKILVDVLTDNDIERIFSPNTLNKIISDCESFKKGVEDVFNTFKEYEVSCSAADFWLKRNGYGDIWFNDWSENIKSVLLEKAKSFDEIKFSLDDNNQVVY